MIFYKTVSAGNDFIHVDIDDLDGESGDKGKLAGVLCRRHAGAGGDGVTFRRNRKDIVDFEIYNRDGGLAELSGNGMAGCSAVLLYLGIFKDRVRLNTTVGIREIVLIERKHQRFLQNVEIGPPDFQNKDHFPFMNEEFQACRYMDIAFYPVSVGNPHAVVLLEAQKSDEDLREIGLTLSTAPLFPHQVNVEFVDLLDSRTCRVTFFERGVGPTDSSSTGSAAVYAVLHRLGKIKDLLYVQSSGGSTKITGKENIYVENSTEIVYKGMFFQS